MKNPNESNNNRPLTKTDAELVLRLLEIVTDEVNRLFYSGMALDESGEESQIQSLRNQITDKQGDIQRLRQNIERVRGYCKKRKEADRQRSK